MIRRMASALVVLGFVAAPATVKGTVTYIDGNRVQVTLVGEKADWVKQAAGLKVGELRGRITDTTLTFTSKKASELKVGAEITLTKGPAAMTGC